MLMVSGAIALVFGIAEALLLKNMLFSVTSGNYSKAAVIMIVKLLLYGAAAILLVFLFSEYLISCVIGYAIGLPVTVTVWFIINSIRAKNADSGDGKYENSDNN